MELQGDHGFWILPRGWMIAQGLATNGAKVYITGRRRQNLQDSANSVNGKLIDKGGQIIP
jgi:NAD(P)-dependent dehydrogenase (short-subunit alcohol dehydrogenase family)